ncbi:hypothetical protein M501DRAFT_1012955 [Patellaria atrata CBS 101060]|uniref:Impact N-terminal domain-containing protein n=1 Tax=Patellaria atrata CBS 101060 TaxID=1346257 RepID=A0A9P4VXA6_9PEZI|nr:hypothetical protein M501DRAFT_1012955 [Patellaria atrata CBS 101060]
MSKATELQALLRFLSQDAKIPLATAIGKVKELQNAGLATLENISKSDQKTIQNIFPDDKASKQVLNAAKRISKKRAAGDSGPASPVKKQKRSIYEEPPTPAQIEQSLVLPDAIKDEGQILSIIIFTNRAPLVLAFAVTLLKYTMPEQPISSRLSLAQAVVSINSRSKAVSLGLEAGKSAEEEGWGEGQPTVKVMGREIKTMKRWGYEWKTKDSKEETKSLDASEDSSQAETLKDDNNAPSLWGIDLDALKKTNSNGGTAAQSKASNSLPIYTPQSARAYLLRSFDSSAGLSSNDYSPKKKPSNATIAERKERNLALLLGALELLFESWAPHIDKTQLDSRTWSWYVRVRPEVESGVAGWGGKGDVKLVDILALRRT